MPITLDLDDPHWPQGICGRETGKLIIGGRSILLLCTRPDFHDPDEACYTEVLWSE